MKRAGALAGPRGEQAGALEKEKGGAAGPASGPSAGGKEEERAGLVLELG